MGYLLLMLMGLGIIGLLAYVFTLIEYIEDWITMRSIKKGRLNDE